MNLSSGMTPEPIRVIYVLGAGRSGSTVLDAILGNHPDVVNVGELGGLHRFGSEYCACGQRKKACEFWSSVLHHWEGSVGKTAAARYPALQQKFESFGYRQLLRLAGTRLYRPKAFDEFLDQTYSQYRSISSVSGKKIIVDSSKNPLRAAVLLQIPGIDLRIVHLVRDGRAVAWSVMKAYEQDVLGGVPTVMKSRPSWRTVSFWMLVNLLASCVKKLGPAKSVLVRYEDFVSDPLRTLERISSVADVDFSQIAQATAAGETMQVGHTIAGNRLRMAGSVTLKPDWEWTRRLPSRDRRVCWAIAGWLLSYYRYSRNVAVLS